MKLQKIFTIAALGLLLFLLAGCAFLDDLHLFRSGQTETAQENETVVEDQLTVTQPATADMEGEIDGQTEGAGQADGSGDGGSDGSEGSGASGGETGQTSAPAEGSRRVVLYFASADGSGLATETRDLPQQQGIARATVNELISGPQSASLSPTLPAAAIVEGMNIADGVCTVDFSSELVEHLSSDSRSQLLAVYSIVNTLTQFDSVDQVRILVDGRTVSGGLGGVDLTAALAPVDL